MRQMVPVSPLRSALGYPVHAPLGRVMNAGSRLDAQKARLVFAPKGPQHVSPGQSAAAKPRSAALGYAPPWVTRRTAVHGALGYAPHRGTRRLAVPAVLVFAEDESS